MTDRNFFADMHELMSAEYEAAGGDRAIARDNIVKKVRATDQELWFGWLDWKGPALVREELKRFDTKTRGETKREARDGRRTAYAHAAAEHERGNPAPLRQFMDMPITINGGSKPLGSLYATDLLLAKAGYDKRAADNRMMGAFLNAVRKKIGERRVDEVWTEEQLKTMWLSIVGSEAA